MKKMLVLWLTLLLLCSMNSCLTDRQGVKQNGCPPEGYVLIKTQSLTELMESCARCKSELNECLERERK